jgi:hypothetical protein
MLGEEGQSKEENSKSIYPRLGKKKEKQNLDWQFSDCIVNEEKSTVICNKCQLLGAKKQIIVRILSDSQGNLRISNFTRHVKVSKFILLCFKICYVIIFTLFQ